jgi:flagellar biosynthetic protein FliS
MEQKDIEGRSKALNHCISIISELQSCLNLKEGGEIASSLDRLYDYMKRRIIKANVDQSVQPLKEIEGLLENLCSAWRELEKKSPDSEKTEAKPRILDSKMVSSGKPVANQLKTLNISI